MAERLTTKQRWVLRMLADKARPPDGEAGWVTSDRTFEDVEVGMVAIHWRTAYALRERGLLWFPYVGSGDGDGTGVALTRAGWAALGRDVPAGIEAHDG